MFYARTKPEDLSLADHLARDRTILANERTLLSYFRTGFGFAAGGLTLLKFFPDDQLLWWTGMVLMVAGLLVTGFGIYRFLTFTSRMRSILQPPPNSEA